MKLEKLNLFYGLSDEEIKLSIDCSKSKLLDIKKEKYIFRQEDAPKYLYFVLSGSVVLSQISVFGKQNYVEQLSAGQSFGQTDLFLEHKMYEFSAQAEVDSQIFAVSRHFFDSSCERNCSHHNKIIFNMMRIFAIESDKNSKKIQLLTCGTLRQRIAYYLMQQSGGKKVVNLTMKREDFAAYLNTTRPSLSRELSSLQDSEIIYLDGRNRIKILNFGLLQDEIDGL